MKTKGDKLYVVRKYVKASSVSQALRKEKAVEVHDVYIDPEWGSKHLPKAIGFLNMDVSSRQAEGDSKE